MKQTGRTDAVLIEALECQVHLGVPLTERRRLQKVLIDLRLRLGLRRAGREDKVERTVDYASVCAEVAKLVRSRRFKLVEAIAEQAAALILKKFPVKEVRLRIRKFSVPHTRSVGVSILRRQRGR